MEEIKSKLTETFEPLQPAANYLDRKLVVLRSWALQMDLFSVGYAAGTTTLLTYPLDLVKVRMQLQGELRPPGSYPIKYSSVPQSIMAIARSPAGVKGLYRGIGQGMFFQGLSNAARVCVFDMCDRSGVTSDMDDQPALSRFIAASVLSGVVGSTLFSPLYLAKIQSQTQASPDLAVGWQHSHPKPRWALWHAFRGHRGYLLSAWQGGSSAALKITGTTMVHLFTYTTLQHVLYSVGLTDSLTNSCVAATLSAIPVVLLTNPLDLICTRMYNQKLGAYYTGIRHCAELTLAREGWRAFWKGCTANYLRTAPQMVVTLVMWDRMRRRGFEHQMLEEQEVNDKTWDGA